MRVLLLLVPLLLAPGPAHALTIGGRFGVEVDGLGESQRSYGVIDPVRIENPTITRETAAQAMTELRASGGRFDHLSFRLTDTAQLGSTRSRNSLSGETTWIQGDDRVHLEGRWDTQGGREEPAPGTNGSVVAAWHRRSLPAKLNTRARLGADWSRTTNADLSGTFDYRILKGDLQLSRAMGTRADLRGLVGYRHKDAEGPRTYDERIGEVEVNSEPRFGDRFDASARIEDRTYRADSSSIPSFLLGQLSARYELRASEPFRPYLDQTLELQNYRGATWVFQDYRSWKAELGTYVFLDKLRRPRSSDVSGELYSADWRLRLGVPIEIYRTYGVGADSVSFLPAFDSVGGIMGIAHEGGESFWFDLTLEAGRRTYREHAETKEIDDLDLRLTSSDYTYLSASLLGQWSIIQKLRADAFLQWDDERHDVEQDNFRLWIANVSLTYSF